MSRLECRHIFLWAESRRRMFYPISTAKECFYQCGTSIKSSLKPHWKLRHSTLFLPVVSLSKASALVKFIVSRWLCKPSNLTYKWHMLSMRISLTLLHCKITILLICLGVLRDLGFPITSPSIFNTSTSYRLKMAAMFDWWHHRTAFPPFWSM